MINKNWNDINYLSISVIALLAFVGSILHTRKYCRLNKEKCDNYSMLSKTFHVTFHILLDSITVGALSTIVYIGLIGYGFNELLSVAIAGFLATEGNNAIYEAKLIVADKLNSQLLKEHLKEEKENE